MRDSGPLASRPSRRRATGAAVACFLALCVGSVVLSAPGRSAPPPERATTAPRPAGDLRTGPDAFVGGQALLFSGRVGPRRKQAIRLQFHMNRPGDVWTDVQGSRGTTDRSGAFRFTFPAPAMENISYRVASSSGVTPGRLLRARAQEVVLTLGRRHPAAYVDRPFVLKADTTPVVRGRRPPAFPGRRVELQERVDGHRWRTVDTDTTDARGRAFFTRTEAEAGNHVYRARQDDWTQGGDRIGWFASFPTTFTVVAEPPPAPSPAPSPTSSATPTGTSGGTGSRADTTTATPAAAPARLTVTRAQESGAQPARAGSGDAVLPTAGRASGSTNASSRWGWGPSLFDFAWEFGESLTSRPYRGSRLEGGWRDTSNGTGRAAHVNGGLFLQSGSGATARHRGTTTATLDGNAQRTGRWEFRLRASADRGRAADYDVRVELVPEGSSVDACTGPVVTVADFTMRERGMRFGVRSREGGTARVGRKAVSLTDQPRNVAVEVGRRHVTWFYDGTVIGSVDVADLGAPLTPRISLVGKRRSTMSPTVLTTDWQRAWTLDHGKQVRSGPSLGRVRTDPAC